MGAPQLIYAIHAAPQHRFPRHPECPERVTAIQAALEQLGALQRALADGQAMQLDAPPLLELPAGLLAAVHTAEHVDSLRQTSASISGPTAVRDPDDPDGPTFATPSSYADALRAACTAVALVDAVVAGSRGSSGTGDGSGGSSGGGGSEAGGGQGSSGRGREHAAATCGFSICRPPGHHATPGDQMGFCLLNNAALAARHAQRAHGLHKASACICMQRRVLVLDWDVHHGNGTQDCFWADPSVLLLDLHQEGVWPGSGAAEEAEAGPGAGATINVPLPWHSGHAAAQLAFEQVVAPAASRFRPDLIIVSAGGWAA
ncbi:hypothetical protein CHLNCDRAFT_137274 [Chlorella variabilis]|uniref:Histone deacetylase domain-containing protein n=1 Tax=Chlorella variabilis TaxID=554065 RepID=E1ZM32_CHLVA|nr:hypothetical protein CHLNCDRAFT_137274 [Chlorella variabilis]EFN52933.1 hypothetical protein CHLNCDRAFT_137274 [Chlorella variabilis]|eukprot:XP_005845035.1 hypothetical protein CHLNCDRAFT_137274 [Chlorella variabilis]